MNISDYTASARDQAWEEARERLASNREFTEKWHRTAEELARLLLNKEISPDEYRERIYEAGERK